MAFLNTVMKTHYSRRNFNLYEINFNNEYYIIMLKIECIKSFVWLHRHIKTAWRKWLVKLSKLSL